MKYYRRFPGDYSSDTRHLSLTEHGAYTLLLDHCYATETKIQSVEAAQKICAATSKRERFAVHFVLENFFELTGEGYSNQRVEKEIKYTESISLVRRRAAQSRHSKHANAQQMDMQMLTIPDNQTTKLRKNTTQTGSFVDESSIMQVQMKGKKQNLAAPFSFPPNVPIYLWNEFAKMRNTIRKPMTNHAAELIGKKLQQLETQGENVIDVVQQSIRNCWQDVFPVRKDQQNAAGKPSKEQLRSERSQQAIARIHGRDSRLADALRANFSGRNNPRTGGDVSGDAERYTPENIAQRILGSSEKK